MGDLSTHFSSREFACGCGCGYDDISLDLVAMLEMIRDAVGSSPLRVSSGCRCQRHNQDVGGAANSAHLRGTAVDLYVTDADQRFRLVAAAIQAGIRRIGVARTFIHLDIDKELPPKVFWTY